jgi:predicted ATPase
MVTQLRIQNFKSLRDVTLDLQRVNLLIGPNNCGKTNVLKALKFFSEFLSGKSISKKQMLTLPYQPVANKEQPLLLTLQTTYSNNYWGSLQIGPQITSENYPYYTIVAGADNDKKGYKGNLFNIKNLEKYFTDFEAAYFGREQGSIEIPDNYKLDRLPSQYGGFYFKKVDETRTYSNNVLVPVNIDSNYNYYDSYAKRAFTAIEKISIYRPDPTKLLGPYPVVNEESVVEDASNLVAFLQVMRNKHHKVYERIEEDLHRFVPEFKTISFDIVEVDKNHSIRLQYPDKSFAKIGLLDNQERTFWSEDLSEGILYFLSLLAIIHQPNPPKLLLLEEPEKGIHPRRIREVLDLIFELAEEKDIQVIMTTHSPLVVDRFSDMPESVFILEKPENETIVKNLQRDIIEPMNKKFREAGEEPIPYTEALGEHWAMGFLGGVPNEYP